MQKMIWQSDVCEVRHDVDSFTGQKKKFWFCTGCLADWRVPGALHEIDGSFKIAPVDHTGHNSDCDECYEKYGKIT